jgi:hypothetical protein
MRQTRNGAAVTSKRRTSLKSVQSNRAEGGIAARPICDDDVTASGAPGHVNVPHIETRLVGLVSHGCPFRSQLTNSTSAPLLCRLLTISMAVQ